MRFMKNAFSLVSMLLMLVVTVIVLLLVARAWTSVAPTARQITSPSIPGLLSDDSHTAEDGEDEAPHRLPTLNEMRENADQHAEELEEARKQIDQ